LTQEDKLTQEEEGLMGNIKKQVKPEHWEKVETKIKQNRNDRQAIEKKIEKITNILKIMDKIETAGRVNVVSASDDYLLEKIINNTLKDTTIYADPNQYFKSNIPILRKYIVDCLHLYQNFQKQAELKK